MGSGSHPPPFAGPEPATNSGPSVTHIILVIILLSIFGYFKDQCRGDKTSHEDVPETKPVRPSKAKILSSFPALGPVSNILTLPSEVFE
jgi:hypothetical protein